MDSLDAHYKFQGGVGNIVHGRRGKVPTLARQVAIPTTALAWMLATAALAWLLHAYQRDSGDSDGLSVPWLVVVPILSILLLIRGAYLGLELLVLNSPWSPTGRQGLPAV